MEPSHSWENSLGHKRPIEDITSTRKCWWVGKADRGTEAVNERQVLPGAQLTCLSLSQGAVGAQCLQESQATGPSSQSTGDGTQWLGLPSPGLGLCPAL